MNKKLSAIVFFLFAGCSCALAQYGVQFSYITPSGFDSYFYKPSVEMELKYTTGTIDSRTRFNFSIGYYSLKPTQDTFPYYQISNAGSTKLLPGYDVIKDYSEIPISAGIEYHPFESRVAPYVGLDLSFNLVNYSYDSYIESQGTDNKSETDWGMSAFPKIGLSYKLNPNWLLMGGIGYNFELVSSSGIDTQSFIKSFLGLSYYLIKPDATPSKPDNTPKNN